jgi:ATP-binding cassette subfamily B protein
MASGEYTSFWGSLRNIAAMTDSRARREIGVLVLLTFASALSEIFTIATIVPFLALLASGSAGTHRRWIDWVLHAVGADSLDKALIAATVALACAAIASAAVRILLQRKTQDFVYSFGHRLSIEVQRRALLQPYSWHVRQNSSQQLANIEKVELLTGMVLFPLVQAAAATTITALIVVLLLRLAPLPTLGTGVVVGVIYYVLALSARRRLNTYSEEIERSFEKRIRILQEGLAGIRDIILDSSHALLLDRFRSIDLRLARARASATFVSAVPRYVVEAAGIITIAVLALALSRREGGLAASLPILGAVALGAQRVLPLIQQLYQGWSSVLGNRAVVDELSRQLTLPLPEVSRSRPRLPFKRSIEFTDVSYAYADRSQHAVTGLTFTIPHGARVALVGPTGSGKSTTADLLMGLLEPTEGSIAVDGVELTDANRESWRANVGHVPQILFLADATIAQNIALSGKVAMDRVREAAALAQLDEFVASLPDGFKTVVGERGERISGGQRQRLAIARAIYRNTPLLVLDEATSALDDETEAAVLEALVRLQKQGRTVVIIAHRSRLIADCDCLIRLEKGRVVEFARGDGVPFKKRRA